MLEFSLQEKRFLLFLLTTFLIGCAVVSYRQLHGDPGLEAWREEQILQARQITAMVATQGQDSVGNSSQKSTQSLLSRKRRLIAKVNINIATAEELAVLERIGPAMAARIVLYREEHGPFQAIEQLQRVKGIGPKTFDRIKDRIEVDTSPR
jgi:comEA protein